MIKDNQQHFNRLHVVLDGLVVIVSYALAWWLKLSGILQTIMLEFFHLNSI